VQVLTRIRVSAGEFGLLAGLVLVAALLLTGVPRYANNLADQALRKDVAALPYQARDITFTQQLDPELDGVDVASAARALDTYRRGLEQPLRGLVGQQWFAASAGADDARAYAPAGPRTTLGLRSEFPVAAASRLTAGRWPATVSTATRVEIAVSAQIAQTLGLGVNAAVTIDRGLYGAVQVVVVGVFEAVDPTAPIWDDMPLALKTYPPLEDQPYRAVAVTDPIGLAIAAGRLKVLSFTWRYRVDERRLDGGNLNALIAALTHTTTNRPVGQVGFRPSLRLGLTTSLGTALARFSEQSRAARSLLAVVQSGLLAALLGLIVLAARLAVERRRQEYALVRARGGGVLRIGGRGLAESLVVLPVAAVAGWRLGLLVTGRPAGTGWLVIAAGAVATLAVPVLAMAGQRRLTFVAGRRDLVSHRPSMRRLTAELFVLVVAVLGTYLLRRRGLSQGSGVDPYLASVPVLLAACAALVALRVSPWPLRQVGRFAARARGTVAFLGLARAGRGTPASVGPVAVLVVAITTGVFCGAVASTIDNARNRVSDLEIPADAALTGFRFAPETVDLLAAVRGVSAVAPVAADPAGTISSTDGVVGQAQIVIVDAGRLAQVVKHRGLTALPQALTGARRGAGPVPAVVSPDLVASLGRGGVAQTQGGGYDFTVGAVADNFPGLPVSVHSFVVLPWQALPAAQAAQIIPNKFLLAGNGFDPAVVRKVGDDGQRAYAGTKVTELPAPAQVTTWAEHRKSLDNEGANDVLTFTYIAGTAGAIVLALLSVGFVVLADARSRGQALSRLRTMGLSGRQGRGLLAYELVPLVGLAVLVGGVVGVFLPDLLGAALGLSTFTGGAVARTYVDPLVVGGLLALVIVALAAALLMENLANRRMRLGELLRVGEES
jgi:putative ABC transport system permease protein